LQNYKKELQSLKIKLDNDANVENYVKLENKLKDSERKNLELQKEIKGYQNIQNEQSKALEKLTNQNEYATKLSTLLEDLKKAREKISQLEEKRLREERTAKN
jgi:hypothetical protein